MIYRWTFFIAGLFFFSGQAVADVSLLGRSAPSFRVAIRAASTGYYISAGPNLPLVADRESANVWETFDLTPAGDGWFSLKAHSNNKFVRFAPNQLVADRDAVGDSQKIKVHVLSEEQQIVCFSTTARRFVCCDKRYANLLADRENVAEWECFELSFPTDYQPAQACPEGMQRKWVVADNEWHKLEWAVGVPGIACDAYFLGPKGAQVRGQYFITPNDSAKTLDGENVTRITVRGLYGEVAVKVPAATYVYYSTSAGRLHTHVPLLPVELPLIPMRVDLLK